MIAAVAYLATDRGALQSGLTPLHVASFMNIVIRVWSKLPDCEGWTLLKLWNLLEKKLHGV